jgi:hypothetical protein
MPEAAFEKWWDESTKTNHLVSTKDAARTVWFGILADLDHHDLARVAQIALGWPDPEQNGNSIGPEGPENPGFRGRWEDERSS